METGNDTILYLVRHGEAESNVRRTLCSWPEKTPAHLTARGREQASAAGESLRGRTIAVIYASPLTRTRETAEAIAEATGARIVVDDRLRETDFGVYDDGPIATMRAKYPSDSDRIDTDASEIESLRHVRERAESFLGDILPKVFGRSSVIVSHADTLSAISSVLSGETAEESATGWSPEHGSVREVRVA